MVTSNCWTLNTKNDVDEPQVVSSDTQLQDWTNKWDLNHHLLISWISKGITDTNKQ
jgi:hypothetical protein